MIKNKKVKITELGFLPYSEAWDIQEEYFSKTIAVKRKNRQLASPILTENHLLLVEHPPVFTLGKSGKIEHLLLKEEALKPKGIKFFKTNRGGDITFHGPGQLVGYPILDLDNFFTDIHKYLRYLEEIIIKTLLDFGLKRIGVAITDDLNIIASALDTVSSQNILPFLKKIIENNDIKTIVVGQPRQKDYSPSVVEKEILKFIDVLKNKFPNVSFERYDERYTSLIAKKVIIKSGVSKSKRKDKSLVDKISATIILQSYLENLKK